MKDYKTVRVCNLFQFLFLFVLDIMRSEHEGGFNMPILQTMHLGKIYEGKVPYTALQDINFQIEKGEFVAIMGPSGSGKSTLLNVISTIDHPTSGSVMIDGKDPHSMNDSQLAHFRRSVLGFIFQDFNLVQTLTVGENIMLPLTLEGMPTSQMKKRMGEVAELLGIGHLLSRRTFEISGGQAQRTAIARAVAVNPSLLLADEPTGNLDSKATKDVMELFQMLNQVHKATILMVTHDSLVASYCKRVLIIKDGKLYQEIVSGGNRQAFRQKIVDAMSLLGGEPHDLI